LLASIAWTGHAAAEEGADRIVHLSADVLHLIAAGAWVGALWPLAAALARDSDGARAARRFSALGIACVATLIATGIANAWYTVGSLPAMIGTPYGRLLTAKLTLFAAMLALASVNRLRLTPRLESGDAPARARLRRNAAIEAALGLAVIALVGVLGATVPALHEQTVWPFAYTLEVPEGAEAMVGVLFVAPLFALGLVVAGARARRHALVGAGAAVVVAALAAGLWLAAAPAHPTTYFRSPAPYAADPIARGAGIYGVRCAICHGARGRGDGPAAASLPQRPTDLAAHFSLHREGDLYWWIEHGIPGTAMPGFAQTVPGSAAWDVLEFLRAQSDAADADVLGAAVRPGIGLAAPDFAFQVGTRPQESLGELRGGMVLLVFYELPGSLARLRALAGVGLHFAHLGVRVIAFPVGGRAAKPGAEGDADMLADPDARVAAAYAPFAPGGAARPVEYLVDRQGDIRARWTPGAVPDWSAMPVLLEQIETLEREPPRPPLARRRHAH
ncbi:MAG TPA: CopD family protein, partial [Burkholderiales bacterium]